MALDTALKRASAVNVGCPWRGILPFPDGSVDQPDRQVVPVLYSGIEAVEPSEETANIALAVFGGGIRAGGIAGGGKRAVGIAGGGKRVR